MSTLSRYATRYALEERFGTQWDIPWDFHPNENFFLEKKGRTKKNRPTQLENRLGFRGELMEFNHSLVGFLFSRFLLVGLFSFLVQKKENKSALPSETSFRSSENLPKFPKFYRSFLRICRHGCSNRERYLMEGLL
jgi:hypothetical protein